MTSNPVVGLGTELLAIKAKVDHGQFQKWVKRECRLQLRTAERAMQVAGLIQENDKLSYLPADGLLALASRAASRYGRRSSHGSTRGRSQHQRRSNERLLRRTQNPMDQGAPSIKSRSQRAN
jgi:hypothetical protein